MRLEDLFRQLVVKVENDLSSTYAAFRRSRVLAADAEGFIVGMDGRLLLCAVPVGKIEVARM